MMQYHKTQFHEGQEPVWVVQDEDGSEVGPVRGGPDGRYVTGYDQAAVETVLRRQGLTIEDLEAELAANAQRAADEQAERDARLSTLRASLTAAEPGTRPTTVAGAMARVESLEQQVRQLQEIVASIMGIPRV